MKRPEEWKILVYLPANTMRLLSVKQYLASKNITVLEHPLYSPDVSQCYFFLFTKSSLNETHFSPVGEAQAQTAEILGEWMDTNVLRSGRNVCGDLMWTWPAVLERIGVSNQSCSINQVIFSPLMHSCQNPCHLIWRIFSVRNARGHETAINNVGAHGAALNLKYGWIKVNGATNFVIISCFFVVAGSVWAFLVIHVFFQGKRTLRVFHVSIMVHIESTMAWGSSLYWNAYRRRPSKAFPEGVAGEACPRRRGRIHHTARAYDLFHALVSTTYLQSQSFILLRNAPQGPGKWTKLRLRV